MDIFKKTTTPDGTVMCTGSVILSVTYPEGKEDAALMLVGVKEKGEEAKIVNVYTGESVIVMLNALVNGKEIMDILKKNNTKESIYQLTHC